MKNQNINYYKVLGVSDDAEDIVIRAAYKVLIQKYHPDKHKNKKEYQDKITEINLAYEILSDEKKRKEYDGTRDKNHFDSQSSSASNDINRELEKDWIDVLEFLPELNEISSRLSLLSKELLTVFKITLLQTKEFNNAKKIADKLEKDFITRYFGSNKAIQQFALKLFLKSDKKALLKLNKAVCLLGSEVDPKIIIEKIEPEVLKNDDDSFIDKHLNILKNSSINMHERARSAFELITYTDIAYVKPLSFLSSFDYEISYGGEEWEVYSTGLVEFAKEKLVEKGYLI
jgi:curved DNA-binding protein CbpA